MTTCDFSGWCIEVTDKFSTSPKDSNNNNQKDINNSQLEVFKKGLLGFFPLDLHLYILMQT